MKPDFPVVGVGASAGGLDAYRQLLRALPGDTGAAFVFIQHLDPNHESMMADLLSKHTSMPVVQAENDMMLDADTVYVIPPNKFIKLVDRGLFLDEPVRERGIRMSIDYFFRTLAEVRGEKAIAILLSGTGSDGTLGIREIKAAGGMVMVQKPEDAEHDGMPRSAIATNAVDFVLPVSEMPETLDRFIKHPYLERREEAQAFSENHPDHFKAIMHLLRTQTEYDFRSYRQGTLERRIHRRMSLKQISALGEYVRCLQDNREEVSLLFRDLLIGVTRFFREPESWTLFGEKAIAQLVDQKEPDAPLRAWVPGCATGEEPYTLAIQIFECLDKFRKSLDVQIFATDLNSEAITAARAGTFPSSIATDVPADLLKKYFVEDGEKFRVNKRLRETVVFATQNVISDPPFSKLDIITCRNLMIYIEPEIQKRMIEMFHFALAEGGYLFLGSSESAERPGRFFEPISKTHRIYRRGAGARIRQGSFPIIPSRERGTARTSGEVGETRGPSAADIARHALLDRFAPASVLINRRQHVLYFHGPLKNYLDFPSGEPTTELTSMVLEDIKSKLRALLNKVADDAERADTVARNVRRNGHEVSVRITVEPVPNPKGDDPHLLVSFEDASEPRDRSKAEEARAKAREDMPEDEPVIRQLEYELQATKEDLQSTIEEMETANEELKASNEEVMSMNEELQSTNEELETSREELQSLNEELSTVNSQLEDKIEEVEASNNDLVNLLASTEIATIFLDTDLRIRRFTPATKEMLRIIETDVGRPIEDLTRRVSDPDLVADARKVLDRLQPVEVEVDNEAGQSFIRRARPYRTLDNKIEGVVVTFADVTGLKKATDRARARGAQQEAVADLGQKALVGGALSSLLDEVTATVATQLEAKYVKVLELQPDGKHLLLRAGVGWKEGIVGKAMVETEIRSQAGYTLQRSAPVVVEDFADEKRFVAPSLLKEHNVKCGASVIIGPVSDPWGVLGAHDDGTGVCEFSIDDVNFLQAAANILWLAIARDQLLQEIEAERSELSQLADALPMQISIVDADMRYRFNNRGYEEWGLDPAKVEGMAVEDVIGKEAFTEVRPYLEKAVRGESQQIEISVDYPDGDLRTNLVSYVPRRNATGGIEGTYAVAVNISDQKRTESELAAALMELETVYQTAPVGLALLSPELKYLRVNEALAEANGVDAKDHIGRSVKDVVPDFGEEAELLRDKVVAGRATLGPLEMTGRTGSGQGRRRTWLTTWSPIFDGSDDVAAILVSIMEITERKAEEERTKVISAELDHRVRNLLATVATIARLSGRKASDVSEFRSDFEGRIQAMARAHSTLAASNWDGMSLQELMDGELKPYETDFGERINVSGPNVVLTPAAVQPIALAVHELATNAAKYGALSSSAGKLKVRWHHSKSLPDHLTVEWRENGMRGLREPETVGFGSRVIKDIVSAQLGADVDYRVRPTGVLCVLDIPNTWFAGSSSTIGKRDNG